ncbi:MAG TPA: hypothetical protein VGI10_28865 [Polyangiaceae bacterium]|jgi:hypothetical protein
MPEQTIHLTALREATNSAQLDPSARECAIRHEHATRFGALLVDLPYFQGFAGELVRHLLGLPPRQSTWGQRLHDGGAILLLRSLVEVARQTRDPAVAAATLGLASHAAIDRSIHPLVNALAKRYPISGDHETSHREAEKLHSICFHEVYFGRDVLGTREVATHFGVQSASAEVLRAVCQAFEQTFGDGPSTADLISFQRGYSLHVALLSSFPGRQLAPRKARELARTRYMRGSWGTFASALESAVASSVRVINAVWAAIEAPSGDRDAALALVAQVLPLGSIDPDGGDAELDAPYVASLSERAAGVSPALARALVC